MIAERILIDASVWIEYFRNQSQNIVDFVMEIARNSEICVPRVVLAELMQGAKSEKELSAIAEFMDAFTIIDQTDHTWVKAGRLSHALRKKGKNVHLTDCYIAVIAQENSCAVLTLDEHFKDIRHHTRLDLVDIDR
ncbi:MAG: tRNA(fMet)-specific endonuclease VapC [Syntrophaceae bacterium PtaU1.Bin231]|nr:MAG: tRNA(fMet)-specific endonuclease VapC [Syntrophaceae bacterium PtaU1.Bin231]